MVNPQDELSFIFAVQHFLVGHAVRMRERGNLASLVFKINMAGGHGGSSGRYDVLRERAFDYAWLVEKIGQ